MQPGIMLRDTVKPRAHNLKALSGHGEFIAQSVVFQVS
jgi:hypothetical protein